MGNFTEYLVLVASLLGGFASLIIILRLLLVPIYTRLKHIENQVTNHIPSQYKELDQKFTEQIKEVKSDLKALDQKFTEQIKEVKSDLKALDQKVDKLAEQVNHRLDKINDRLDKLFELQSKGR